MGLLTLGAVLTAILDAVVLAFLTGELARVFAHFLAHSRMGLQELLQFRVIAHVVWIIEQARIAVHLSRHLRMPVHELVIIAQFGSIDVIVRLGDRRQGLAQRHCTQSYP